MTEFFRVRAPDEIFETLARFPRLGREEVELSALPGRVPAGELRASGDLPPFARATMDGYAVRASDTFGASDSLPALFGVAGEVRMGERPDLAVGRGEAVSIPTGGMLPEGADAVVMVEHTHRLDAGSIEVARPVTAA